MSHFIAVFPEYDIGLLQAFSDCLALVMICLVFVRVVLGGTRFRHGDPSKELPMQPKLPYLGMLRVGQTPQSQGHFRDHPHNEAYINGGQTGCSAFWLDKVLEQDTLGWIVDRRGDQRGSYRDAMSAGPQLAAFARASFQ